MRREELPPTWDRLMAKRKSGLIKPPANGSRRDYNEVRPHGAIGNKVPISLLKPAGANQSVSGDEDRKRQFRMSHVG